jgi:hypothetical protein
MFTQCDVAEVLKTLHEDYVPFELEKLRDAVAIFLNKFRSLPPNERVAIRDQVGPLHGAKLLRCSQELAARAVRNNSADDVALGLLAVALEGIQSDPRSAALSLCLLHHSAVKLGSDPVPLFTEAAAHGTTKAREFMIGYFAKGERNIRAYRIAEGYGPHGFYYEVVAS